MHQFHFRKIVNRAFVTVFVSTCLATIVSAQQPAPDPAAQERAEALNRQPDNIGTGRFPAMKEELASLPGHVVYRPRDLDALGTEKLGVVAWGNGGCSEDGASSRFHLLELASHGYLVIASGRILSGPGAPPRAAPVAGQTPTRTVATDLTTAIDWALQENAREGSPFAGRIDPAQIAVSGFSCGGLQALRIAADPRVSAAVLQNTGILIEAPANPIPGMDLVKDELLKLHTPVLYILGGETDIAYVNGMDDYKRINHVPVAVANLPVGHGGTYAQENGGSAATVAVNWLQWQLRDDSEAARYFVGADCVLCRDAEWTLERKGLE